MKTRLDYIEFMKPYMGRDSALKSYEISQMNSEDKFMNHWTPSMGLEAAKVSWKLKQSLMGEQNRSALVMGDIEPYKSQIDGSMIMSRSQHRTHLRDNNCIEIGNETSFLNKEIKPMSAPDGLKETLIREVNSKLR